MLIVGMYTEQEVDPQIVLNVRETESSSWDLIDAVADPVSAAATFSLLRGGDFTKIEGSGSGPLQDGVAWVNENLRTSTIGDDYEVRLTTISGTYANTGAPLANGVFGDLNGTRSWEWILAGVGTLDFTGTLLLREKADTSNQAAATVTINLDVV